MRSEASLGAARRLHPFSWLFVLLTQLRQVAFPLIVLLVLGRGEWWELLGAVGAVVLALYALIYSFGFRYWLGATELVVKEGIFFRTERHIPFARIQNVVEKRNPLHRLFGVSELALESAGGSKPEAVMNVITVADAAHLTHVLRGTPTTLDGDAEAQPPRDDLFAMSLKDTLLLGLLTNRGVLVLGAGAYFLSQLQDSATSYYFDWRFFAKLVGEWMGFGKSLFHGPLAPILGTVFAIAAFLLVLKVLSIAMALLQFYGFRLRRDDERVATETGLLTRHGANARRDKIQRLVIGESWLARRFGRRWLSCDVAAGVRDIDKEEHSRLKWLTPLATPERIDAVVAEVAPGLSPERVDWRPLHPRAWWRFAKGGIYVWSLALPAAVYFLGPKLAIAGWLVMALWTTLYARGWASFTRYGWNGDVLALRRGWLGRQWLVTRIAKGQVVSLHQSPFDRRARMAKLRFDTAGASQVLDEFEIPYLDERVARELFEDISRTLARQTVDIVPVATTAPASL